MDFDKEKKEIAATISYPPYQIGLFGFGLSGYFGLCENIQDTVKRGCTWPLTYDKKRAGYAMEIFRKLYAIEL